MFFRKLLLSCIVFATISAGRAPASIKEVNTKRWMSAFTDKTLLSIPIIPGSHNSASFQPMRTLHEAGFIRAFWARQQALSIADQLDVGVRFLDFRIRVHTEPDWPGDRVVISHTIDTSYSLELALSEVKEFIRLNPTECVILYMRVDWAHRFLYNADDPVITSPERRSIRNILDESGIVFANIGTQPLSEVKVGALAGKALLLLPGGGDVLPKEDGVNPPFLDSRKDYSVCDIWNTGLNHSDARNKIHAHMRGSYTAPKCIGGICIDKTYILPPACTSPQLNEWFAESLRMNPDFTKRMEAGPIGMIMLDFVDHQIVTEMLSYNFQP